MIETSETTTKIIQSLLTFQGIVKAVKRDGVNPHFKSKYATLENVLDAAKPTLNEHGIVVTQAAGAIIEGAVSVTTRFSHESGEYMQSTLHVPLGKRDPQGVGSALTYGFRYSLMGMLGLPPTDDDDGENAMDRNGEYSTSRKSSAALKREDAWAEFEKDLAECTSFVALDTIKDKWRTKVKKDGWNKSWIDAMPDAFEQAQNSIEDLMEKDAA